MAKDKVIEVNSEKGKMIDIVIDGVKIAECEAFTFTEKKSGNILGRIEGFKRYTKEEIEKAFQKGFEGSKE